jgi:hypothetical protein
LKFQAKNPQFKKNRFSFSAHAYQLSDLEEFGPNRTAGRHELKKKIGFS